MPKEPFWWNKFGGNSCLHCGRLCCLQPAKVIVIHICSTYMHPVAYTEGGGVVALLNKVCRHTIFFWHTPFRSSSHISWYSRLTAVKYRDKSWGFSYLSLCKPNHWESTDYCRDCCEHTVGSGTSWFKYEDGKIGRKQWYIFVFLTSKLCILVLSR